jgi:hypothetical protein
MAKKKVTVEAEVETNAGEATAEFVSLRKQIKETRLEIEALSQVGDMQGLDKARTKLADLEDSFDKARAQSKEFHDSLADMPGPAGIAGKAIQGVDSAFKALIANPIVATIAAIAGIFLALRESLSKTEEGQKKLEKITNSLTKVFNGFIAILEPLAMFLADLIEKFLGNEKVMNVLAKTAGVLNAVFSVTMSIVKSLASFIGNNLVNSFRTAVGVISGFGKILKGVFTFDLDLIKEGISGAMESVKTGVSNFVDNVKDTGKRLATGIVDGVTEGFKQGEESFKRGYKRLTDAEKEANKKALEEQKKYLELRKKQIEDAAKLEEAELKNRMAKELAGAGDEMSRIAIEEKFAQQIYAVKKKALEDEAKLYAPNSPEAVAIKTSLLDLQTDLLNLQSSFSEKRRAIIVKDFQTLMEFLQKQYEEEEKLAKKNADEDRLITIGAIQEKIKALDVLSNLNNVDFQQDKERLQQKAILLRFQMEEELSNTELTERQKIEIKQKYANATTQLEKDVTAIENAERAARLENFKAYMDGVIGLGNLLQQVAGRNKKLAIAGIVIEKAATIAKIIAQMASVPAILPPGIPNPAFIPAQIGGALSIAATVAAAAKSIAEINRVEGIQGGGASSGGGSSMPAFSTSTAVAPTIGSAGQSQTGTLGGIVSRAIERDNSRDAPLRAYVVQNDIRTEQQLSRRLRTAARLS